MLILIVYVIFSLQFQEVILQARKLNIPMVIDAVSIYFDKHIYNYNVHFIFIYNILLK